MTNASAYDHEALPEIEMVLLLESPRLTARPCSAELLVKAAFQMSLLHSDHRNEAFRHHHISNPHIFEH